MLVPRCRRLAVTVAGGCRFLRFGRRGLRGCHVRRAVRPGTFACTTAAAPSTPAPTPAATAAFRALGTAFRRRRRGGHSPGGVLTRHLGGVAITVVAIDGLALATVAITSALGEALAPAL